MRGYYEESDEVRQQREHAEHAAEYRHEEDLGVQPALHVFDRNGDGWEVWLNPDRTPDTGLCVGTGATRQAAVQEAVTTLEAALRLLQETPAPDDGRERDNRRAKP